ncbi:C-type lectin BfL-2-like [Anneissia japonica]|uniref:C-type lectin BfL-2-like n=1 Tax=Anneissia japonica TaxID=1529436 RepID=UPI001425646F|nr:C-type lectin BfL-2-like [Anneissia japonica]
MGIVLLLGIIIAVAASPSDGSLCRKCPKFWLQNGNKCYRFYASLKTWDEASKACSSCENSHGKLVSIGSEDENKFVSTLWQTYNNNPSASGYTYWIGLRRSGSTWRWCDKSPYRYKKWGAGEPNNSGGKENCVHQWKKNDNYLTWNDIPCDYMLPYVCEIPMEK